MEISPNYDETGMSLHYNTESIARSIMYPRFFRSRKLKLGTVDDLEWVDIMKDTYQDMGGGHLRDVKFERPQSALNYYVRTTFGPKNTPVYIFDDHSHALFGWAEAFKEGHTSLGATLVHPDEHKDGKKAYHLPDLHWPLSKWAQYAQAIDIDRFIHPAIETGLVSDFYWVNYKSRTNEQTAYQLGREEVACYVTGWPKIRQIMEETDPKYLILNPDIDYFKFLTDPDLVNEDLQNLKFAMARAGVVTIALSPGFIDEQKSLELVKRLFD